MIRMYHFQAIAMKDATLIHTWKSDPYMIEMALDETSKSTIETQENDIKRSLNNPYSDYHLIVYKNEKIGYVRVDWMDDLKTYAWLRFALGKYRNQGHMSRALKMYIKTLFEQKCHRIESEVYEYNKPSITLLLNLGFKQEGVKREAHTYNSKYTDIIVLGLLKNDFIS